MPQLDYFYGKGYNDEGTYKQIVWNYATKQQEVLEEPFDDQEEYLQPAGYMDQFNTELLQFRFVQWNGAAFSLSVLDDYVLLKNTCGEPVPGEGETIGQIVPSFRYKRSTNEVEAFAQTFIINSAIHEIIPDSDPALACRVFSLPTDVAIHSFEFEGQTVNVYHDGNGGVDYLPEEVEEAGIELIKEPSTHNLAGNDVVLKVQTNNMHNISFGVPLVGRKSYAALIIPSSVASGNKLRISFPAEAFNDLPDRDSESYVEFTFLSQLDGSGKSIRLKGALSQALWVENIVLQDIKSNYKISSVFDIGYTVAGGSPAITLTAKSKGAAFSVAASFSDGGEASIVHGASYIAGTDEDFRRNYNINVWLQDEEGNSIIAEAVAPDKNGIAQFNFSQVIFPQLSYNLPAVWSSTVLPAANIAKRFKFRYAESYGVPEVIKEIKETNEYLFVKGGTKKLHELEGFDFLNDHILQNKYLTWQPYTKIVSKQQPEWLYWLDTTGESELALTINIFYTDGSQIDVGYQNAFPGETGKVFIIPTGYAQLGIGNFNGEKKVKYYTVSVHAQPSGTMVGEVFKYIVDHNYRQNEKFFLFANSLGGFDTVRTVGDSIHSVEVASETAETLLPEGANASKHQLKKYDPIMIELFNSGTGYISKAYKEVLIDMLMSREAYEIVGEKFIPIVITTNKEQLFAAIDQSLYSLRFDYRYSHKNKFFSKI